MNRQKIGMILFWLGITSIIIWQSLTWLHAPELRAHTAEELRGTIYAVDGAMGFFRYTLLVSLGMMLPIIGVLLYTSKKGSYIWLLGSLGSSLLGLGMMWEPSKHIPALFGIGGTIILLSYTGLLWLWTRTYADYQGPAITGRQIQLLGYSFLFSTGLLLCSHFGDSKLLALTTSGLPTVGSGEMINICLALGMLLLFVGQYLADKNSEKNQPVNG